MVVKGRLHGGPVLLVPVLLAISSGNIFQSTIISTGYMVMVVKGRLPGETSVTAK